MRSVKFVVPALLLALCWGAWWAVQAPAQAKKDRAADEAAIRKAGKEYAAAVRKGDGKAIASFWTADGDYVDPAGNSLSARELIAQDYSQDGNGPEGPEIEPEVTSIRFAADDMAIEDGTFTSVGGAKNLDKQGRYTAVWVRQGGKWLLDVLRETAPAGNAPQISTNNPLEDLDYLQGDWQGQGDGMAFAVTARWNDAHTFLVRNIAMRAQDESLVSGTQIIAFDPATQTVRSWAFDSHGGISEGAWSHHGDSWIAETRGVHADGSHTTSTNIYTPGQDNSLNWRSTNSTVNGQALPDLSVRFVRKESKS
jgi:uncharacterized protein (TIGR02246 family)